MNLFASDIFCWLDDFNYQP